MKNFYNILWVDAIVNAKDYKNNDPGWKSSIFWLLTSMNAINIIAVLFWLKYFNVYEHRFIFNFNSDLLAVGLIESLLNVLAPIAIINYFLVFYRNRYKRLIAKNSHYEGKVALFYSLGSIFLLVITVVILKIIK
ncbi:hypothetical protein N9164_07305 [Draconibacterium sp.]|nr:hypothetical protein [Draconibacterium sp.]